MHVVTARRARCRTRCCRSAWRRTRGCRTRRRATPASPSSAPSRASCPPSSPTTPSPRGCCRCSPWSALAASSAASSLPRHHRLLLFHHQHPRLPPSPPPPDLAPPPPRTAQAMLPVASSHEDVGLAHAAVLASAQTPPFWHVPLKCHDVRAAGFLRSMSLSPCGCTAMNAPVSRATAVVPESHASSRRGSGGPSRRPSVWRGSPRCARQGEG